MGDREKKPLGAEALGHVARRFKALSDPVRLSLLQALFEGEATVTGLCRATGAGPANASKHLAVLMAEGIVARRKDGLNAWYRIVDPSVRKLCEVVCGSLARRFEDARGAFEA